MRHGGDAGWRVRRGFALNPGLDASYELVGVGKRGRHGVGV
ncbi:Uncharacterised protein [Bordetella pertussis]|nr:Uncharacterised protein [Bordetella pertussis]